MLEGNLEFQGTETLEKRKKGAKASSCVPEEQQKKMAEERMAWLLMAPKIHSFIPQIYCVPTVCQALF